MRKTFKSILVSLIGIGSVISISAQEHDRIYVYPENIYNDWVLTAREPNDGLFTYEKKEYYIRGVRNRVKADFKFSRKDNVFRLSYNDGKVYKRCGNDRRRNSPPSWRKGKWQLLKEGKNVLLQLQYFVAVNGGKYKLISQELFKIVYLVKDKLILQKLENEI